MRMPHVSSSLIVCSLLLLMAPNSSKAASPTSGTQPTEAKRPASLTATVGNLLIRIDGPKMWTLSRIEWNGALLGIEESAYGTVINIKNVGFLGTAHKLDVPGKPGEVESENVTRLRFFIDDRQLDAMSEQMSVGGKRFRMERESRIRSFSLQSTLQVRDERIFETVRIKNDEGADVKVIYPFMYAWTPSATQYMFGADDGNQIAGEFLRERGESPRYIIEKSVRWAAVYDPASKKGSVSYVLALPDKVEGWMQIADGPQVYRKLYLMCFSESSVPKGFDETWQIVSGFFSADEEQWKVKAQKQAAELRALSF